MAMTLLGSSARPLVGVHFPPFCQRPNSSSATFRSLCCCSAAPDLIQWVQQQGGFVHPSLRILPSDTSGLGLISSLPVSSGTPLIRLPPHLPLALPCPDNVLPRSPDAVLLDLTKRVPENDLQAGAYILLSYGPLSNDVLLLDYGFVVHKNPHDYVELRYDNSLLDAASVAASLSCTSFAHLAPWQGMILERLNLQGPWASPQIKVGGRDLVDGRLLAALRVLYAQDANIVLNKDLNMLQAWDPVPPLGSEIESQVLRSLIAVCALSLGKFSSTIKEDENILTNKLLTPSGRLAVEYRMSKKQSLVDAMRGFTRKLNLLRTEDSGNSTKN